MSDQGFRNLRAAEIKHGRVAMMAALGAVWGPQFLLKRLQLLAVVKLGQENVVGWSQFSTVLGNGLCRYGFVTLLVSGVGWTIGTAGAQLSHAKQ